jgi:hypothetical protein
MSRHLPSAYRALSPDPAKRAFGKEFVVHPPSLIDPDLGEFGIALSTSSPAYIQSMLSR